MSEPQSDTQPSHGNGDQRTRSNYWFEDGNVVLQAEETLFRVHQSILSRHSQIFKDTFAMVNPSLENEYIEGCPVVGLSDTAEDLANIISLLYETDKILTFGSKLPADALGSMLRLGRKYFIAFLENDALTRLHHDCPTLLEDWDSLSDKDQQIEDTDVELVSTMKIISLAHEFHLFTILPAAYAQYLWLQDLTSLPDEDSIPKEARKRCIIGNTKILAYLKDKLADALCPPMVLPSKTCSSRDKCEANRWNAIKNLQVWDTEGPEDFGIFYSLDSRVTGDLCSRCRTAVSKFGRTVREEFWSMLPTFFDLPAWADLKDGL